jgi:hypothetical protein
MITILEFLAITGACFLSLLIYVLIKTIIQTKNNKNKPLKF